MIEVGHLLGLLGEFVLVALYTLSNSHFETILRCFSDLEIR
ncbi:hypothetical protein MiAbB_03652 [Microcystis aeruginosa NIES-4285]|uniref:Uncharacterized protein n=1 Tax=Microcystis aeruginosa NIES-4285 TaxID=2497681 RepID=A0A402DHK0_MICAE|nr:hypothetical protein MiAbB_03652 [Microcystis aeruginosa NIES-4285]